MVSYMHRTSTSLGDDRLGDIMDMPNHCLVLVYNEYAAVTNTKYGR